MINIEEEVIRVVNSTLDIELNNNNMQDDLQQIGMDSVKFISIVVTLESDFDIEYPDECLLMTQSNTLMKIANIVSDVLEKKSTEGESE